jgi:DNA-binding winged helix-turn-helix (wHTH) protein
MSQAAQPSRPHSAGRNVRFGPFELSLETGELRKHGVRVRLQHRPFQILAALIESPGRLVTREELRNRLWSSDVFVDFESGLNTAVNRLRLALGDSAENPVYVETLSRLGYRFLATVEIFYDQPQQITPAAIVAIPHAREPSAESALALLAQTPAPARRARILFPALAAAAVLIAIAAGVVIRS